SRRRKACRYWGSARRDRSCDVDDVIERHRVVGEVIAPRVDRDRIRPGLWERDRVDEAAVLELTVRVRVDYGRVGRDDLEREVISRRLEVNADALVRRAVEKELD